METIKKSNEELMKMFLEANLNTLMPEAFATALEKKIPELPKNKQAKLKKQAKLMKRHPQFFAMQYANTKVPEKQRKAKTAVDQNSQSFKNFAAACEKLMGYYEKNTKMIQEELIKTYASQGINLIIED